MDRDEVILSYVQNRLGPDERAAFEADMAQDSALSAEVDLMRLVRDDLAKAPKHDGAEAVWDRLSENMTPPPANTNSRPFMQVLRYAAVAGLSVAVWQMAVVPRLSGPDQDFRTATTPSDAFTIQMKFVDAATISDIGALLVPLSGTITDGPSALGLVMLAFPDQASRDAAMDVLRSRSDLIELVVDD